MIKFVREFLHWLARVVSTPSGIKFIEVWPQVEERLNSADLQISGMRQEGDALWRELSAVGLTGNALTMKLSVLESVVAPWFAFGRVLRWINSFLGSLAEAIPGVDFVKEYKEMLELTAEDFHELPPPPGTILDLR